MLTCYGHRILAMMLFPVEGQTHFYIFENPFRKQFGVATYFCLFLGKTK